MLVLSEFTTGSYAAIDAIRRLTERLAGHIYFGAIALRQVVRLALLPELQAVDTRI
jgi:hypothetical protein